MSTSLAPAAIGLAGAVIGATAGLVGALGGQRLQARRARRAQLIDHFISAFGNSAGEGLTNNLAKAMKEAARVGDRAKVRRLIAAEDAYEIVHALHSILLDALNAERASGGLQPLELADVHRLILDPEGSAQQLAWEAGKPVPKIEPPQPSASSTSSRRSGLGRLWAVKRQQATTNDDR